MHWMYVTYTLLVTYMFYIVFTCSTLNPLLLLRYMLALYVIWNSPTAGVRFNVIAADKSCYTTSIARVGLFINITHIQFLLPLELAYLDFPYGWDELV